MRKNRTMPTILFIAILAVIAATILYATRHQTAWSWPVPEEAKQLRNPLQPSEAALNSARSIYLDKCAHCHGDTGAGDGRDAEHYDPSPADFTDPKEMDGITDGELFYKISEGKKPMPNFKRKLTEEQRWQLVLLIRSFASGGGAAHVRNFTTRRNSSRFDCR
jgi:mono/diheme cytochrome c family protein